MEEILVNRILYSNILLVHKILVKAVLCLTVVRDTATEITTKSLSLEGFGSSNIKNMWFIVDIKYPVIKTSVQSFTIS